MTALLELRQKISEVYGRYEAYVRICTKCLLAFLVFYMIHSQLSGSMNPRSWAGLICWLPYWHHSWLQERLPRSWDLPEV